LRPFDLESIQASIVEQADQEDVKDLWSLGARRFRMEYSP